MILRGQAAADGLPKVNSFLDSVERILEAAPFYVEKYLW